MKKLQEMGKKAKEVSRILAVKSAREKNLALEKMAKVLEEDLESILKANEKDLKKGKEEGLTEALLERLTLNEERVHGMAGGLRKMASLPDPLSTVIKEWVNEDGLRISQRRVPLGVLGIIYESRPNVTADASGLSIKSGNAVVLRGGREALESNLAITKALQKGLEEANFPKETIQLISDPSRELAEEFMTMNEYLDCLIPRGGAGLISVVKEQATVPVIETGIGVCHLYIEESADLDMAKKIILNAKVQRPSVCNAVETLLIHEKLAKDFLPEIVKELEKEGVECRGDEKARAIVSMKEATEEDYKAEYLDLILALKVVKDTKEAFKHLEKYSSGHSEGIVTTNYQVAEDYLNEVDAAVIYVNASTRFSDGEVFGLGGEIGISTQKLHARGPMGLEALTSYKYVVEGSGQIRE